jgi:hypothetical protein
MRRVHILVEGQTEETFVKELLHPHLLRFQVLPIPIIAKTGYTSSGRAARGGIVSYQRVRNDLKLLLKDTSVSMVTTMIDYYGLPTDFPGAAEKRIGTYLDRVLRLEERFGRDIDDPRFLPYLALHEFEAMLFASPEHIASAFPGSSRHDALRKIRASVGSPEEINERPDCAPSRRLKALFPGYEKPLHGPLIALEIGLDRIRAECSHFRSWIEKLETLRPSQVIASTCCLSAVPVLSTTHLEAL